MNALDPAEVARLKALAPRPTYFDGVLMRTTLEARMAEFLKATGARWEYEPAAFQGGGGSYLPDFRIGDATFVEVKPRTWPLKPEREREAQFRKAWLALEANVPRPTLLWVVEDGFAVVMSGGLEDTLARVRAAELPAGLMADFVRDPERYGGVVRPRVPWFNGRYHAAGWLGFCGLSCRRWVLSTEVTEVCGVVRPRFCWACRVRPLAAVDWLTYRSPAAA